MEATAELFLYEASRAQLVAEVIRPALGQGRVVLCDRFCDSTVAYQGYGRGLDRGLIAHLNAVATDGLAPDLTFLLDLDPALGLERATQRGLQLRQRQDRMERELLEFHQRVRDGYRTIARGRAGAGGGGGRGPGDDRDRGRDPPEGGGRAGVRRPRADRERLRR